MIRIMRAQCIVCHAAEQGKVLDAESVKQYRLSKSLYLDTTALQLPDETNVPKKLSLRSMMGEVLEAVGVKTPDYNVVPKASKKMAKEKKAKRLFDSVDLDPVVTDIGMGMQDVDNELNRQKES
jgi:hypothetical protein